MSAGNRAVGCPAIAPPKIERRLRAGAVVSAYRSAGICMADRDGLKGNGGRSPEKFRQMCASACQADSLLNGFTPAFVEAGANELARIGCAALTIGERHRFQIALDPDDLQFSSYRDANTEAVDRLAGLEHATLAVAKAEALLVLQAQFDIDCAINAFEAFGDNSPPVVRLSGEG